MNPEASFIHSHIWPGPSYQFLLADDLAGAFNQGYEDFEGTATQLHGIVCRFEQPFLGQ